MTASLEWTLHNLSCTMACPALASIYDDYTPAAFHCGICASQSTRTQATQVCAEHAVALQLQALKKCEQR